MPRSKLSAGITSLIESDSEPDFDSFEAVGVDSYLDEARAAPATKTTRRGRPTANRVTKPAQRQPPIKRGGAAAARAKALETTALEDDAGDEAAVSSPAKPTRGRPKVSKPPPAAETAQNVTRAKGRRGRPPKDRTNDEAEVPTPGKHDVSHTEPNTEPMDMDELEDTVPRSAKPDARQDVGKPLEKDDDHTDDGSLRRQLEEMHRKYRSLEARHNELREATVKEAERNFDRLKKQAEESSGAAKQLIAELKAELATQRKLADRGREVQQELHLSEANRAELESQVTSLNSSLVQARTESKTLNAKLTAARNADLKVPGSALKNKGALAAASNADAIKAAQAKEDLYGDLTGLIVRGLQRDGDEDIFDCIQTGRNGTLHFKLALDPLEEVDNYEDVQCTYRPQLDSDRDEALMDVLPDFLVEEITFPRTEASKFYMRVYKSLTERPQ